MPGILAVEEQTRLRFRSVRRCAHVAPESTDVSQQESCQARSTLGIRAASRYIVVEFKLPGAVCVAGDAQVISAAEVCSKLDLMIAADMRPVVNELKLMLSFR